MKILIHRGAEEIGGNCIALESQGKTILLDLGAPLMGSLHGKDALPPVKGLTDGSNPDLLGIVIPIPMQITMGWLGSRIRPSPYILGQKPIECCKQP